MKITTYIFFVDSLYGRNRRLFLDPEPFAHIGEAWEFVKNNLRPGEAISMFWPVYHDDAPRIEIKYPASHFPYGMKGNHNAKSKT